MAKERTYSYSPAHRALEITCIVLFFVFEAVLIGRVVWGLVDPGVGAWWWVPILTVIPAYLLADFISGLVHFIFDEFGTEETPILGPSFIKPFREHHDDPKGMTKHDFVETNGNNSIVELPAVLLTVWLVPTDVLWGLSLGMFLGAFFFFVFLTNQLHKWAHEDDPPRLVRTLQRWNLVLAPGHHDVHHTAPFDTYFCITVGWLNPILQKVRFYDAIRWAFGKELQQSKKAGARSG